MDGKPTRIREIVAVKGIYEIGHLELIWSLMPDVIGTIRKTFPDDRMLFTCMFLNLLSLCLYFQILDNTDGKYSVREVLRILSRIKMYSMERSDLNSSKF